MSCGQACGALARQGLPVLYVAGEESPEQVRLRAPALLEQKHAEHFLLQRRRTFEYFQSPDGVDTKYRAPGAKKQRGRPSPNSARNRARIASSRRACASGAMGVPFMPSRSMVGSDVGKRVGDEMKTLACPFTGEQVTLLPALNPDVALIHVQRCDPYGNAQLDGLQFMDIDMAMAAKRVILTTERIVSNNQIRRTPDQTRIPFFTVDAVVEAPIGCAPHECYGIYEPFFSALDDYAERISKDPDKGCKQYLEEYYYEPKSWTDYLSKIGMDAVLDACRRGRSVHND